MEQRMDSPNLPMQCNDPVQVYRDGESMVHIPHVAQF